MSLAAFQPRSNATLETSWQCRSTSSPLYQRLQELLARLMEAHAARCTTPGGIRSFDRDLFVASFLSEVFPSAFRFESGAVLDIHGRQSGLLDILIESPFVPCVPAGAESRWYLAEGVAAALTVQSNLVAVWENVLAMAGRLAPLQRNFASFPSSGPAPKRRIPFFVVGESGWTTPEAVKQRLGDGELDGILLIEPAIFASSLAFGGVIARGPWALWTFIASLHQAIAGLAAASAELLPYAMEKRPVIPRVPERAAERPGSGVEAERTSGNRGRRTLRQA